MNAPPPALARPIALFLGLRRGVGMAAALVDRERDGIWGFGHISRESARLPLGDTVFEIGSVTKVFTATVLACMVRDRLLSLEDTVRAALDGRVRLPDWSGREVTLLHLATHTSTLPRASRRMLAKGRRNLANPYRDYTVEDLYADLAEFQPGPELGRRFEYSNLGMGLLGHLLALRAQRRYEELVKVLVCAPLGLDDTAITLDEGQRARLAPGHMFGRPAPPWDLPVLAGAGALRSTARDMHRFLEANLREGDALQGALAMTHERRVRVTAELSIGLAWHRTPLAAGRPEAVWHRGETGGSRSFIGFVPEHQQGLALLANSSAGLEELGLDLLRELDAG